MYSMLEIRCGGFDLSKVKMSKGKKLSALVEEGFEGLNCVDKLSIK